MSAVREGIIGKVAVTYFEWAGLYDQKIILPWRVIDGPASAEAVADCTRALDVTADPLRLKLNSLFSTFDASGGCLSPRSWQIGMRGLVGFCRDGRCVILNVRP